MRAETAAALLCALATTHAQAAPKFSTIYTFQGSADGSGPASALVQGPDGALYGVTATGGASNFGTVYQLTPPAKKKGSWVKTTLHSFTSGTDGATPSGEVTFDAAGNLYGVTSAGGGAQICAFSDAATCGTIYRLAPPAKAGGAWTETVLYAFQSNTDGYYPTGRLLLGKKGELYGTVGYGGGGSGNSLCSEIVSGCGAVFELAPPAAGHTIWAKTTLYAFTGGADGASPFGGLRADGAGVIGTAPYGGAAGNSNDSCGYSDGLIPGCGVVFTLTPGKKGHPWAETVQYAFNAAANDADGWSPNGSLLPEAKTYYGSTQGGPSTPSNQGTVFAVSPPSIKGGQWSETVLHSFSPADGTPSPSLPIGGLITVKGHAGALFGATTSNSGTGAAGTIFSLRPPGKNQTVWTETTLHVFTGPDGAAPQAGVIADSAGTLFGTTSAGGSAGAGTVFEITP